jgi:uncharacterized membrane protein YoaK (UPF0700 family)
VGASVVIGPGLTVCPSVPAERTHGRRSGRGAAVPGVALAVVLAVVAGCVDAVSFERVFDVFPANQSGNAVFLGIELGHGRTGAAWRPALAIAAFGLGVTVAMVIGGRVRDRVRSVLLLAIELVLLLPLTIVLIDDPTPRADLHALATGALLLLTAGAMGMQTEVIGRVAGVAVSTTYQTGGITHIAESVARRLAPDRRPETVGPAVAVLLVVLLGYIGGAALGASLRSTRTAMVVPVALLAVTALVHLLVLRRRSPST